MPEDPSTTTGAPSAITSSSQSSLQIDYAPCPWRSRHTPSGAAGTDLCVACLVDKTGRTFQSISPLRSQPWKKPAGSTRVPRHPQTNPGQADSEATLGVNIASKAALLNCRGSASTVLCRQHQAEARCLDQVDPARIVETGLLQPAVDIAKGVRLGPQVVEVVQRLEPCQGCRG